MTGGSRGVSLSRCAGGSVSILEFAENPRQNRRSASPVPREGASE